MGGGLEGICLGFFLVELLACFNLSFEKLAMDSERKEFWCHYAKTIIFVIQDADTNGRLETGLKIIFRTNVQKLEYHLTP